MSVALFFCQFPSFAYRLRGFTTGIVSSNTVPPIINREAAVSAGPSEPVWSRRKPETTGATTADNMIEPLKIPTEAPVSPG